MKLFSKFAKTSPSHPESGIGFGCMGITSFYGPAMDEGDAMKLLQTVYDEGCRHFDTAEMYGNDDPNKHNEVYLGKFFQTIPDRNSYSVATKFWPTGTDCTYDVVKEHLLGSLKRLQLDYVDLYYSHRVTSVEHGVNFVKAAQKLKEEGLIKEIGLSEVSGAWLEQITKQSGGIKIDAVQQEWSILTRSLEEELVPVCRKLNVTIVAYSPLCRNLLVQSTNDAPPTDWRADLPRYKAYEQNKKFASQVHAIAESLKCTPAQVCLAWLYQKAAALQVSVVPIPGTTKIERAVGNIQSITNVTLSDENMKILDAMNDQVVGERYSDNFMGNNMTIESQKQ